MTVEDYEEILARLKAEMPRMPWKSTGGGFRTDQGPNALWELDIIYTRTGDWRGRLWHRPSGTYIEAPLMASEPIYRPLSAMHEALRMLNEWHKDIFSTLTVAGLDT